MVAKAAFFVLGMIATVLLIVASYYARVHDAPAMTCAVSGSEINAPKDVQAFAKTADFHQVHRYLYNSGFVLRNFYAEGDGTAFVYVKASALDKPCFFRNLGD